MTENKTGSHNVALTEPLTWLEGDIPVSTRFDDPYYSKADGLAETRHVFINGNRLVERCPLLKHCTIAELGFGTGLNFLASLIEWQNVAPPSASLHFISFEKYPLSAAEMSRALSHWPELNTLGTRLCELYATAITDGSSPIRIDWSEACKLTLYTGDARDQLKMADFKADAWFLDGFSPAKNPQLWEPDLLQQVAEHTVENGTFATYTAAGWVRRNLERAGFDVERVPGHAGKRQMSIGSLRPV